MIPITTYRAQLRTLLSPTERSVFSKLNTPNKIQGYLDHLPINFEPEGDTLFSPRELLKARRAHCIEGALFAATSLAYHGQPPLLLDFQTIKEDQDHVVTLFKQQGLWGAISKTNHPLLRWRDPVYRSVRELAMSYFHEYILPSGKKSLKTYSRPFDLRRYKPERWVTASESLFWLAEELDDSHHFPIVPKKGRIRLRYASENERQLLTLPEWPKRPHRQRK